MQWQAAWWCQVSLWSQISIIPDHSNWWWTSTRYYSWRRFRSHGHCNQFGGWSEDKTLPWQYRGKTDSYIWLLPYFSWTHQWVHYQWGTFFFSWINQRSFLRTSMESTWWPQWFWSSKLHCDGKKVQMFMKWQMYLCLYSLLYIYIYYIQYIYIYIFTPRKIPLDTIGYLYNPVYTQKIY